MQMIDDGGSDLCTALSLGQSVEISRPVCGHRNMIIPISYSSDRKNTIVITN